MADNYESMWGTRDPKRRMNAVRNGKGGNEERKDESTTMANI